MVFEKHRDYGNKRDQKLRDMEFMYKDKLSRATSIQAYGSLQKAPESQLPGFHHSIIALEAMNGQLSCMTIVF